MKYHEDQPMKNLTKHEPYIKENQNYDNLRINDLLFHVTTPTHTKMSFMSNNAAPLGGF